MPTDTGARVNIAFQNECITGTVHIGMSDEISEQYFYGVMSRFTIQDIFRVHGVHSRLPPPIANIGFFEGLEVMFDAIMQCTI